MVSFQLIWSNFSRLILRSIPFVLLVFLIPLTSLAYAENVKEIWENGTLVLEDGEKIGLLGVQVSEEAMPVLETLLRDKKIRIEKEGEGIPAVGSMMEVEKGYIYTQASHLDLPASPKTTPSRKEVMVNLSLIEMGSAKVDMAASFSQKEIFKKAEGEAREKGYGLWSYEPPQVKKKKRV